MMLEDYRRKQNELFFAAFPHCRRPAVMRATVTAMTKLSEKTWMYGIRPQSGENPPEIPGIKSHVEVEAGVGGTVAVALIDGALSQLVIIDEVIP